MRLITEVSQAAPPFVHASSCQYLASLLTWRCRRTWFGSPAATVAASAWYEGSCRIIPSLHFDIKRLRMQRNSEGYKAQACAHKGHDDVLEEEVDTEMELLL